MWVNYNYDQMIAWRNANSLFRCQLNGNRYIVTTHPLAFNLVTHLIEVWKVEIEWQVILWDTIFRGEITGFDDSSDWIAILNWKWQPDVLLNVPLIIILCYMKLNNAVEKCWNLFILHFWINLIIHLNGLRKLKEKMPP